MLKRLARYIIRDEIQRLKLACGAAWNEGFHEGWNKAKKNQKTTILNPQDHQYWRKYPEKKELES